MKKESGRSMIEMLAVLALIGIITIGAISGYRTAMIKNESNNILDLVSIVSVTAQTKPNDIQAHDGKTVWQVIGKDQRDYRCINDFTGYRGDADHASGEVTVHFRTDLDRCRQVKDITTQQWGNLWSEVKSTYTPPVENF